ncbi:MAG: hypothetical protein ABIK73_07490 [candidate division WOR-3 bacterium]
MKKVLLLKPALDLPPGAVVGLQDFDAEALVKSGIAEYAPDEARLLINKDFTKTGSLKSECITLEEFIEEEKGKNYPKK